MGGEKLLTDLGLELDAWTLITNGVLSFEFITLQRIGHTSKDIDLKMESPSMPIEIFNWHYRIISYI